MIGHGFYCAELADDAAGDKEMLEMAAEEAKALERQIKELEERLKVSFWIGYFLDFYLEEHLNLNVQSGYMSTLNQFLLA